MPDKTPGVSDPISYDAGGDRVTEPVGRRDTRSGVAVVQGEVRDAAGRPVVEAVVVASHRAVHEERALGQARTDDRGRYRIDYRSDTTVHLIVRVAGPNAGTWLATSPIRFNATSDETINLAVGGGAFRGASAFETLSDAIAPRLGNAKLVDLTAEDMTVLRVELAAQSWEVDRMAAAARLTGDTGLDDPLLFGLMRAGLPTELHALLAEDPEVQAQAFDNAVAQNWITSDAAKDKPAVLARLRALVAERAFDKPEGATASVGDLLAIALPDAAQRQDFLTRYAARTGTREAFWNELSKDKQFRDRIADLHWSLSLGALTRNHAPLVRALDERRRRGEIASVKDLARLDEADWKALLGRDAAGAVIGAPASVPGASAEEKTTRYARAMARMLEDTFPTAAVFGRMAKDDVTHKDGLAAFEKSNPAFRFDGVPLQKYLAGNAHALDGIEAKEAVVGELAALQRLAKFAPRYSQLRALKRDGIESAQAAYSMGKTAFVAKYADSFGYQEATAAYASAATIAASAMALVSDGAPQFNTGTSATPFVSAKGDGIPDWETLFGSMDLCACDQCRSVLSPAAYLVDVLQFLKRRQATAGKSPKAVLFDRRADLGVIELTCENTNTPMPYVDLVNEILEDTVSPGTGPAAATRQTRAKQEELAANPEYINGAAYDKLAQQVFPWRLPFDLWTEEVRTYVGHLGVARVDLMAVLGGAAPSRAAIAAEALGLCRAEHLIITGHAAALTPPHTPPEAWGFPAGAPAVWVTTTSNVRTFLDKASLIYDELDQLLRCRFINVAGELSITSTDPSDPHTCDTTKLIIAGLTAAHLDRIHRFVRLWRATGWTILELDKAIDGLQAAIADVNLRLDDDLLVKLSDIDALRERWKLPVDGLVAFWSTIDIRDTVDADSLYRRLFQNPTVLKPVDPDFTLVGTQLSVEVTNPANARISTHETTVLAGLMITAQDLAALTATEVTDDVLDLAHLSRLYRWSALGRALKMPLRDLVTLKSLSGIDPFDATDTGRVARFIAVADKIRATGTTVAGLDYLLRHNAAPSSGLAPAQDAQAVILDQIRAGLQKVAFDNAYAPEPPDLTGEETKRRLGVVLAQADVDRAMGLLDGSWTDTTAKNAFIDSVLASFLDAADAKHKLVGPDPSFLPLTDPAARRAYVLAPLLAYLRRTQSEALVKQTLSEALPVEAQTAASLLTVWVKGITDAGKPAIEEFLAPGFADSAPTLAMTAANFPGAFALLTRLQKIGGLITDRGIAGAQLAWMFEDAATAGWLDPATLPATAADPPASFAAWERLVDLCTLRDGLPLREAALQAVFDRARDVTATRPQVLDEIAARTGWNRDDLVFLDGAAGFNLSFPAAYRDERALTRLKAAFDVLARLGVSAEQARAWTGEAPGEPQARAARQAAAAKHDEAEWLTLARPLRDVLREKQRAALVGYLVPRANTAAGQHWTDVNELYAHFLIDVEMTPVMLTSRIKQAMSSAQLFTQRCLMNLEPGVKADANVDPDWLQWKWMKSYRVWEANRKVFLWPENWVEPELRDDKSPFFEQMEQELLQAEITAETAEDAFSHYLESLHAVARLEIVGMYHEQEENPDSGEPIIDNLHVVGRTYAKPHAYYYRRREDGAFWTPWEKIDLEIEGDIVLPVVWNRKLYLFWPMFLVQSDQKTITMPAAGGSVPAAQKNWEIRLAWSERKGGQFQAQRVSEKFITTPYLEGFAWFTPRELYSFKALFVGDELVVRLYSYTLAKYQWAFWDFRLSGCDGSPQVVDIWWSESNFRPLVSVLGTLTRYNQFVESSETYEPSGDKLYLPQGAFPPSPKKNGSWVSEDDYDNARHNVRTLDTTPGTFRVLPPHQDLEFASQRPFFFQDRQRTFFVEPERRIVLAGWATAPGPELIDLLDDYLYEAQPIPIPDPGDPVFAGERLAFAFTRSSPVGDGGPQAIRGAPVEDLDASVRSSGALAPSPGARAASLRVLSDAAPATRMALPFASSIARALDRAPASKSAAILTRAGASTVIRAPAIDIKDKGIAFYTTKTYYDFETFYHPFLCQFRKELLRDGIDGLMQRKLQVQPQTFLSPPQTFSFSSVYHPTSAVLTPYPKEDVDFSARAAYGLYNWELFFHAPLLIATNLYRAQRFEDAQRWFHYVFDPTDASAYSAPRRFWRMGWFFNTTTATYQQEKIEKIMADLAAGTADPDLIESVRQWRDNPFNPHLVARLRTTAFQKTVVMKYLDNLIAWGDQLFRRDTIESINEATQLYVLAAEILGRRPEVVKPRATPVVQTYNALEPKLDLLTEHFANVLVEAEALVPVSGGGSAPASEPPPVTLPAMMYFAVPKNDKLLAYWDTVADRLFKIRHGMNIEGVVRSLALFEPPIDPALLVKAAAAGLDLSSVLSDLNAPLSPYRFSVLTAKASELAQEVKSLGAALLAALEKRDAEALSLLRATHELKVLDAVKQVRKKQIDEANESLASARTYKELVTLRRDYYIGLQNNGLLGFEDAQIGNLGTAKDLQTASAVIQGVITVLALFPELKIGSPTTVGATFGGLNLGAALTASASATSASSAVYGTMSSMSSASGNFERRRQEWEQQVKLADKELAQVERQIAAAELRQAIAEKELDSQNLQIQNAKEQERFFKDKFTSKQLYDWMVGQIASVYFQSYQLAYDVAKRAERSFRHELGLEDSSFIRFGYWDGLKKGLFAGEKLLQDIKRLEAAYLDQNRREYELQKHVSLALTDPAALLALKQTGECFLEIPETLFDQDFPGHYLRRLRAVSVTIPAVVGPYAGVHATLTLLESSVRKNTTTTGGYPRTGDDDPRFLDVTAPVQSTATSHANNDTGLFELSFRDERYLPFEGRGAISRWHLTLDRDTNLFDFASLTDVVLHVQYTARDGGAALKAAAKGALPTAGVRLFSFKHEFPSEWHRFLHPQDTDAAQSIAVALAGRFPFHRFGTDPKLVRVDLFMKIKNLPAAPADIPVELYDNAAGSGTDWMTDDLSTDANLDGLHHAGRTFPTSKPAGTWLLKVTGASLPAFARTSVTVDGTTYHHLAPDLVVDVLLLAHFDRS